MNEGIFDVRKAPKLDNPGRIIDLRPRELLRDIAGVVSGDTGVDFGSGTGFFALPMAELVGSQGKVYAVDNSEEMMEHLRAKNPPANVILVNRDVRRTGLNSRIANFCLLAFILHEVKKPDILLAEAFRLLKPGGRLVVVEWKAELDSPGPPRNKRISKAQLEDLFNRVGVNFGRYIDWSLNHYVVLGNKPAIMK